ncbi:hypothetical protein IC229_15175 [Spirosoma sp. BT702]|uniref:Uncharacterized protein n=1 Tax=Spirosoma profusum TaxID=2771354 RepID=A0A926Y3K0_9BACT|nr:hypothetical protein [Spirosoma profusum]MBD2701990.1 hypothetical protein [Spirosoma profusum]
MKTSRGRFIRIIAYFLIGMGLFACQSSEQRSTESAIPITPAFYHWKATYNPTQSEIEEIKRLNVNKLYVHFFDVDWDPKTRQPIPKALLRFAQKPMGNVVPVVFITNRTLTLLTPAALSELAGHVTQMIRQIAQKQTITFKEVQFDCDWSVSTRDRYFKLLRLLSNQLNCPISATIRLHQVKYTDQTGIPPVARGMLMLYNVADWKNPSTRNSIYDAEVAGQYVSFVATYPLPLDVVLPLFRWTVVYRNGRFLTFLNNIDRNELANRTFLNALPDTNRFVARNDTSAFGFSVRRGDLFRAEAVSHQALLTAKEQLLQKLDNQPITFALYHLDSLVLAPYSREILQTLFRPLP